MKSILRTIRISPKKANLIASLVRNKNALEAIDILKFTPKRTAPVLKKLIESAIANAENNFKQEKEGLYIKEIIVTEGPTYKRSIPISKGRMHPILKRTSHITVKLENANVQSPEKTNAKSDTKTEVKKTKEVKVKKAEEKAEKTEDSK